MFWAFCAFTDKTSGELDRKWERERGGGTEVTYSKRPQAAALQQGEHLLYQLGYQSAQINLESNLLKYRVKTTPKTQNPRYKNTSNVMY